MEKDVKALQDAGGIPADQITSILNSVTFELPDCGETVVMRKPKGTDLIAAEKDKTVSADSTYEALLATISQLCTFDGRPRNWADIVGYALEDIEELSMQYSLLKTQGKRLRAAKSEDSSSTTPL